MPLLRYDEFRSFLVEAVSRVARKQYPESKSLDAVVRYVESEVKEPGIAEFLINKNVYAYVERYGLDSADAYCAVFDRYVKSPLLVKNFETLCNRWRKLSVGALSPNFNCTDLSGKKVSLSDFKGKYVYIDIWATWCGPCQLLRRGYKVSVGKYGNTEIDFVAERNGELEYIQVTADMTAKETFDREMAPLTTIKDNYRKRVLTLDKFTVGNYDGIEVKNVVEWLTDK